MKFSKAIGIAGGAGPLASAFLYQTIIEQCQKNFNSNDYHEFPEIIIESYPFIRGDNQKIEQDISRCFEKLRIVGAELFCVASHSFHGYLPDCSSLAFVNLVEETLNEAAHLNMTKGLILAAQPTIDLKLYDQGTLTCIYPSENDQKMVTDLIRKIAGGGITKEEATLFDLWIDRLDQIPFDGVILACTELSVLYQRFLSKSDKRYQWINPVEVLAKKLLNLAE